MRHSVFLLNTVTALVRVYYDLTGNFQEIIMLQITDSFSLGLHDAGLKSQKKSSET